MKQTKQGALRVEMKWQREKEKKRKEEGIKK